ncbi:putative quinol monooxygenase [Williamsia sterculiae]|uniref:Quinol monooxygenase YgiN n=1 Tax=Williamsia sterculiae TaxID=1344003 RepID=A0A1N7CMT2_9NOCA|nr:antibiotic biosynthesis monooxygenase [Williamsia sterculiae]SIR64949.1 Quinol monooxygenase YgiN [Williamsia sterculiae]
MTVTQPVTVLIHIRAHAGKEDAARDALQEAIATSHKPGMISSREFADPSDPRSFFAIQEWEDQSFFAAHMGSVAGDLPTSTAMLAEPPAVRVLFEISR